MPGSIRPWVTAGVAVVGASVIAVAPFEPAPSGTDIRIATSALEIIATPSPIDFYPQVVMRSLENAGDLLSQYLSAPLPIVKAIGDSQLAALADIMNAADRGDVVAVVTAVLQAVATPVENLVKVAGTGQPFRMTASLIVRLALPIVSSVLAAGSAAGDVLEALADVDFISALSAVANIPARIVDGFLNGRVDADADEYFGVLTPVRESPVAGQVTGPIAFLIDSLQEIGDTISPPEPDARAAGPAALPALGAAAVTLPTAPPSEANPPSNGPAAEPAPPSAGPNEPAGGAGDDPEHSEDTSDAPPDGGGDSDEESGAAPADPGTAPGVRSDDSPAPSDSGSLPRDADSDGSDDSPGRAADDATSSGTGSGQ